MCVNLYLLSNQQLVVAPGIEVGVFDLQLGMAQYIVYAAADALREGRDGTEGGDKLTQLRTVEDDADGLVAQQVGFVPP